MTICRMLDALRNLNGIRAVLENCCVIPQCVAIGEFRDQLEVIETNEVYNFFIIYI